MFGSLAHLITAATPNPDGPPRHVPPPTAVNLPQCQLQLPGPGPGPESEPVAVGTHDAAGGRETPLTAILQGLTRPADQVSVFHLEALGVHVKSDASLAELIPASSCLPDFAKWDDSSRENAEATDTDFRPQLSNGRLAPGALKYVNLRQSLLIDNDKAFGAVRRNTLKPGEKPVRLGYCHDFFRNLESLTGFWDDTSKPRPADRRGNASAANGDGHSSKPTGDRDHTWYRTSTGSAMPAQYRTQLLTSFLKLVTYDFSCSIMSRREPRLYIQAAEHSAGSPVPVPAHTSSYYSSGCNFVFRMPTDRESAKSGVVEGPIAAVSPRHTTNFPPNGREQEAVIDLCREIIAALITAQHRAREGRKEERVGKDAWWTTKPRWGGGTGGPIGKEAEILEPRDVTAALVNDDYERPGNAGSSSAAEGSPPDGLASRAPGAISSIISPTSRRPSSPHAAGLPPDPKRPRKGLAIYDAYRMVRAPSFNWDPKTRYIHIGRQRGVNHDDVFVISSLFHHVSVMRVRVPDRLLQVLAGAPDQKGRDWGRLEVWRTKWFDLFVPNDRAEAMKFVWGVMAYAMRKVEDCPGEDKEMEIQGFPNQAGGSKASGKASGQV